MFWLTGLGLSLVSSLAYGMLFNIPVRTLLAGGFIGMSGWATLRLVAAIGDFQSQYTIFIAASVVSLLSQLLSIWLRVPSTVFSVAGILPLVPGSTAYKAMLTFVNGDLLGGLALGVKTSMEAGAIAAGLILGLSVFTLWKGFVVRYARSHQRDH
ncbi:threonine/serine exporter family protein [Brevibacillus sp. B_LB10_24]|uniref:threonine/serine exporter family protein n=1 Tax=Brevibacillus sp. B_LB10_24 TaxID=3380645 RepID=UPI0038BAE818